MLLALLEFLRVSQMTFFLILPNKAAVSKRAAQASVRIRMHSEVCNLCKRPHLKTSRRKPKGAGEEVEKHKE